MTESQNSMTFGHSFMFHDFSMTIFFFFFYLIRFSRLSSLRGNPAPVLFRYWDRLTVLFLPKAGDRFYGDENDCKERWFCIHLEN